MCFMFFYFFFFSSRRRHTRLVSDWSSDVCSSDLRALEPLEGVELMQLRRGVDRLLDIARGPGRLASALDIDRRYDGIDLCGRGPLWLASAVRAVGRIECSTRIGISREIERKLRFFERDNAFVSGPRHSRTRRSSR